MSIRKVPTFELSGSGRFLQCGAGRVELPVRVNGAEQVIYFATQDCELRPSDEALVATTLLPCMAAGYDYPGPLALDKRFQASLPLIQDFYRTWLPACQGIAVPGTPTELAAPVKRAPRTGACFSAGVDSFYTLLTHQDEITHLCLVHGMDFPLENTELRTDVSRRVRQVGKALGKEVIEVETNCRAFLDSYVSWLVGYGSVLRAMALMLDGFGKFYIPGSHYGPCLCLDGCHPVLDPLWNTAGLEFVHDACGVTRFRKCEFVTRHPITHEHLRVCQQNRPGVYNCCQCEKCFRTMIYLQALDRLELSMTFPKPLDLSKQYTSCMQPIVIQDFYAPVLNYLQDTGKHPELQKYLEGLLFQPLWTRCYGHYRALRKDLKHWVRNVFEDKPRVH